ncbi:MAG: hypothetical protein AABM43_05050 [Actinomycetota bacterium]
MAILLPAAALGESDTTQFSVIPGPLGFGGAPGLPGVPSLPLDGRARTLSARMANFEVSDASGSGLGWSITVSGGDSPGKSPVLKQYCPMAACGADRGPGYIGGGSALPADSLTLDSRGARFDGQGGTTGTPPSHQCDEGCFVDAPPDSPSKVVVAGSRAGMGTFQTNGFSVSSIRLVAPSTARSLPPREVYRVDLSWSLNSGP